MAKQMPYYATRGVAESVPLDLQLLLWRLVEAVEEENPVTDYLHIFECSQVRHLGKWCQQKVLHRQEQPPLCYELVVDGVSAPFFGVIWVIKDGEYATMLFPEEY